MSKSKVKSYQETLKDLQEHLTELKQMRAMFGSDYLRNLEIEAIKRQIATIRKEIFFQEHPYLQKYRIHIEELPLVIACSIAIIIMILSYIAIQTTSPNLAVIYHFLCIITSPIFLFFGVRQYKVFTKRLIAQSKYQIEFEYPKLLTEIENSVSLLNREGDNG